MSGRAALLFAQHNQAWADKQSGASPRPVAHRGYQAPVAASRATDSPDTPLMLAALENDVQRLHEINSISRKQEVKRAELLPRYRDYLTKHMAAGKKPGAVLVRNMIWAFDTDQPDYAMSLASYAYAKGGAIMPEGFKRNFANYILGTVGDIAAAQTSAGQPVTDHICTVAKWLHDHPEWDIVDKIKAALLKGQGGWLEQNEAPESALNCYEQAQELDKGVNLRRKIKQLKGDNTP